MNIRKAYLAGGSAAAAALAVLLLIMFGGFNASGGVSATANTVDAPTSTTTLAPNVACGSIDRRYFAYEAPAGSNNFGPDQQFADVSAAYKRLTEKAAVDPLWFATIEEFAVHGMNLDANVATAKAQAYANDRASWGAACTAFFAELASVRLADDPNSYTTLGMVPGASPMDMPRLVHSDQAVAVGQALYFTYKGNERELRIVCDFQPVAHEFPGVPPLTPPVAPPPADNPPYTPPGDTPPYTPPGDTPPPTTRTTEVPPPTTRTTEQPPPRCVPPTPYGEWPVCKSGPEHDVLLNTDVPAQVQGPGAGGADAPSTPTDSDTGCDGACQNPMTSVAPPAATMQPTLPVDPPQVQAPEPVIPGIEQAPPATSVAPADTVCGDADGDGIPDDC